MEKEIENTLKSLRLKFADDQPEVSWYSVNNKVKYLVKKLNYTEGFTKHTNTKTGLVWYSKEF